MDTSIPQTVQEYIKSVNEGDPAAYIGLFAENAVVNDNGREFRGLAAIKGWCDSDIFAVNVKLEVLDTKEASGTSTIITKVEGTFDRKGLPDPVIISHTIMARDGKISELTCRLAQWPVRA